jgi:hypothetical protein
VALLAGCAGGAEAEMATDIANHLQAAVPSVGKVVTITEDNDPNDLIGRPSGYTDAAVVYDSEAECTEPGVDWPARSGLGHEAPGSAAWKQDERKHRPDAW